MRKIPLDQALVTLGRTDPTFNEEVRRLLAPVKDRFFQAAARRDEPKDELHTPPPYMTDPALRSVAIQLAELALQRGIDINLASNTEGGTILHECVLLRGNALAAEAVQWLLAHGADPNRPRDDGETPTSLAVKLGRTELAELMKEGGGHR